MNELTQAQKDAIARKLWIEFLQCALRYDIKGASVDDYREVLDLSADLAQVEAKKQYRRRPKLRVVE